MGGKSVNRLEMMRAWARHDVEIWRAFRQTVSGTSVDLAGSRVLDIGCGTNAPMTVLLHSAGVAVTGIDGTLGHRWGLGFKPSRYREYYREAGLLRTLRKLMGELVYDREYFSAMARDAGLRLTEKNLDLRRMTVERLEFDDETFDVVHSNATWEHVADVAAANRELARVLKCGGLAYIEIHLFPSLSGGHDLPWIVPDRTMLGNVVPWQHLRDPVWQAPVFLNRLRERDFRRLFDATDGLTVMEWKTEYTEGHDLLTPALQDELSMYSFEELTKRSIIVVLRKSA